MLDDKFGWGVNIDNVWTFAGLPQPKSMLLPYVLSMNLPRGPIEIFEHPKAGEAVKENLNLPSEAEPEEVVKELCDDLVARLKEARIDFVRAWLPWNFFNKKVDDPSEFVMDTFVQTLKSNGIEIIAVLGNGYSRFLPQGANVENVQKYIHQIAPASAEIVRHYSGLVKLWQIENEPNWWKQHMAAHWRSGLIWLEPDSDVIILKSLHDVVREECPDARIIINIEGDRHKVNYDRYTKYCDIIGLDFYPGYAHPHKTSADEIKQASEVKKETGKQVIIAETGQPSGPHLLGYSENRQAEYVKSACETAHSCDAIEALCIWRFADSYWRSFPMQENHFGLLTKERNPKAAWFEYVNQIKEKT